MNRFLLILIIGVLSVLGAQARETVKGTVKDAHGEPLPGVKVEVPGTAQYVFTDLDGAFQIILRDPVKKLDFTYPGFGTTSHRVAPEMTVVLGKGWAGREKGYRGMIDLEGGIGIKGKATFKSAGCEVKDLYSFSMFGLSVTHGYQFNKHLFVGLGYGAYLDLAKYQDVSKSTWSDGSVHYDTWEDFPLSGVHIPVFVSARWDFGLSQKTAPYVGLRIGYAGFISFDNDYHIADASGYQENHWSNLYVQQNHCGYLYFAPTIGYRMTLHNKRGMNLGLSLMMGRRSKFTVTQTEDSYSDTGDWSNADVTYKFKQRGSDMLMFNIGFDF